MPFQEISSPSLRKLFVQQLEGLILSGELRPGDRLPTERELADEMKISKTVVHEGLRELHHLGFLQVGLPDKKTASSILDLRYYLEAPALRQLAARHTPGDLAALRALQQKAEEASLSGVGPLAEALLRYHRGVTFLSGNTITPLIFNAFARINLEFWSDYVRLEGIARSLHTLSRFTKLIEAGEGDAAAELLRQGLERFRAALCQ